MATEEKNESSEEWAEIDITPSEDKEADVAFEVEEKWTDLLQLVLITVIGAYFGGRSIEKVKK